MTAHTSDDFQNSMTYLREREVDHAYGNGSGDVGAAGRLHDR